MKKSKRSVKARLSALLALSLLSVSAWSQLAWIKKETALLSEPKTTGTARNVLGPKTKATVLIRKGIWVQIQANGENGWVKLSSLRFGDSGNYRTSLSDLKTGREGAGNNVAATGARGLEAETLALAKADYKGFSQFKDISQDTALLIELRKIKKTREISAISLKPGTENESTVYKTGDRQTTKKPKRRTEIDDEF